MPDHWRRALIRAALREAGYDAVGARGVRQVQLVRSTVTGRGAVRVMIVDQDALAGTDSASVTSSLMQRFGDVDAILLARATIRSPRGPWRRVLRRPVTVEEIVRAVEELAPLSPEMRHAIDLA